MLSKMIHKYTTGTYTGIGTTCVESETCFEKKHEKKTSQIRKLQKMP